MLHSQQSHNTATLTFAMSHNDIPSVVLVFFFLYATLAVKATENLFITKFFLYELIDVSNAKGLGTPWYVFSFDSHRV